MQEEWPCCNSCKIILFRNTHLVDADTVQEVSEDGLGVQGSLIQIDAFGLRHKDGAAHTCTRRGSLVKILDCVHTMQSAACSISCSHK